MIKAILLQVILGTLKYYIYIHQRPRRTENSQTIREIIEFRFDFQSTPRIVSPTTEFSVQLIFSGFGVAIKKPDKYCHKTDCFWKTYFVFQKQSVLWQYLSRYPQTSSAHFFSQHFRSDIKYMSNVLSMVNFGDTRRLKRLTTPMKLSSIWQLSHIGFSTQETSFAFHCIHQNWWSKRWNLG